MRYLITGGSGYIGSRLTELLVARDDTEAVINLDVRPPAVPWPKTRYVRGDVRDRAAIRELLTSEKVDALLHLAFVLNPIHDEQLMYDIDVNGTHAVLWAASEAKTKQVLVTSSATAYGAFPDNPKPMSEEWPVRGHPEFPYARHKADVDRLCQLWARENPRRTMTIVRPCIVFGPNVDNFIIRAYQGPFFFVMDGANEAFQLIHEDDVVSAIAGLLDARAKGAFNVAADGTMTWRESAELAGLRLREAKLRTVKRIYGALWAIHFPGVEAPPGNLDFIRYPWTVSSEKLKAEIGWEPSLDTREIFEQTMRAKGLWRETAKAVPAVPAAA